MMHITSGDAAAERLRLVVPGEEVLPWRDVLHEGPVPDLPLARLSPLRARFIADRGWADYEAVMRDFAERDAALERAAAEDEVVLWLEHDLVDQLQLLQLLDHFAVHSPRRLSLVCIGAFPGVERFVGLAQLSPDQLASLFPGRAAVTTDQLTLAREAWAAFRAPRPLGLAALLRRDTSSLPFLHPALRRLVEHFPSARDGLNRTERQILALVAAGVREPLLLFRAQQELEEAPFLGDVVFLDYLAGLLADDEPLLRRAEPGSGDPQGALRLTERGEAVRAGQVVRDPPDRWIGGTRLRPADGGRPWSAEALDERR